jgi:hypothetical protein
VNAVEIDLMQPIDPSKSPKVHIPALNHMMDEAFSDTQWSVVDQWGINQGREALYNDHVHFSGPLSQATWHIILSSLCGAEVVGGMGK